MDVDGSLENSGAVSVKQASIDSSNLEIGLAVINPVEALVHLLEAQVHLPEALVHLLEALVCLLEALVHLLEALVHLLEALVHLLSQVMDGSEDVLLVMNSASDNSRLGEVGHCEGVEW